ncbi:MAG: hypothetical protein ABWX59_11390 [Microbacteriaceae bacterium]
MKAMRARLVPVSGIAVAVTLAFMLSACAPDSPTVVPTEEPATPIFASDEEALAAAEAAYAEYLEVTDGLGHDTTADMRALDDVVTADYVSVPTENIAALRASGSRIVGSTSFDSTSLQQISMIDRETALLTFYTCLDVSAVRVVDSDGVDVTSPSRTNRVPLEIDMAIHRGPPIKLLVSRSGQWPGNEVC